MKETHGLILFDLDYTLLNTCYVEWECRRLAIEMFNINSSNREPLIDTLKKPSKDNLSTLNYKDFSSVTEDGLEQYYLKKYTVDSMSTVLSTENDELFLPHTKHIMDQLTEVRKKGHIKIGIISNANEKYIRTVLKTLKLDDKIDYIGWSGMSHSIESETYYARSKPAPEMIVFIYNKAMSSSNAPLSSNAPIFVIGDRRTDIEAGKRAVNMTVGESAKKYIKHPISTCLYNGYQQYNDKDIADIEPTYVAHNPEEFKRRIDEMLAEITMGMITYEHNLKTFNSKHPLAENKGLKRSQSYMDLTCKPSQSATLVSRMW